MMKQTDYAARQAKGKIALRNDAHATQGRQAHSGRYLGLCSTCTHSAGCALQNNPEQPVLFCEEFDSSPLAIEPPVSVPKGSASDGNLGLCANCDKRRFCNFLRPEGGTWHCEEYE